MLPTFTVLPAQDDSIPLRTVAGLRDSLLSAISAKVHISYLVDRSVKSV